MDQNPSSPENTAGKPTEAGAENPIGSPAKQEFNGRALLKELALWFLRMPANVCFEIKQRMNIVNQTVSVVFSGVVCAMLGIAVPASALEFHVSPTGDDAVAGTVTKPFRTVQRAKAEVRKTVAAGLRNAVTVFLHGGTYELSEPLVFGPADSGTEAFPITYAAFTNEAVVLSGGRTITNWKKAEQGQWTADLPESKSGKWFFRQLVVNDRRAVRARWPDEDGGLLIATVGGGTRDFTFNKPLPKETLAGQGAEMVVYGHWSITRGLITASDEKQVRTATRMGWIGHGDYTTASPGKVCYLEHARAFLDKPGEWFLDAAAGVLRYIPREGEDPAKLVAVAPRLERLLVIAGTKERPVRNLRFRGILFEHADFPLPAIGYNEIQAGHYGTAVTEPTYVQPVGIECVYAEGCRFERCRIAHLNSAGIGFGPGCRKNAVTGCAIEDIGGNGVMIGWRGRGKLRAANQPGGTLDADWDDQTDAPASNEVANCHIQRCGADSRGSVGICVAFSTDTRVAHNLIHDLPYTGISVGFRWNTTPSTQARCVVEYNHIHDVMKMLADGGGIYTLGLQPGTVLRGNLIHDVYRRACAQGSPNNGFFVDEGSTGFLFESNVVYKTSGESVRFNQNSRASHKWTVNFFGDTDAKAEGARATINKAGIESEYR